MGLTGRFDTFSFHALFAGKTWQPPRTVLPAVGGGAGAGVCETWGMIGMDVCVGFAVAEARAAAVAAAVAGPGRCGSAPSRYPPEGVGIACPVGPVQAVRTTSEHTTAVPSRRPGSCERRRITPG